MKRVISVLLVVLICGLMFTSCGGASVGSKEIAGKWAWKLDTKLMSNIASAAAEGSEDGLSDMLNLIFDPSIKASCNVYFTFNENGTGKVEVDEEEFKDFISAIIDKFLEKLKDNKSLIVDIMNSQSDENYNLDKLEEELAATGMSWEDLISYLDSVFDELSDSFTGDDSPMNDVITNSDFKFELVDGFLTVKDVDSGMLAGDSKIKVSLEGDTMTLDLSEKELPFSSIELTKVD